MGKKEFCQICKLDRTCGHNFDNECEMVYAFLSWNLKIVYECSYCGCHIIRPIKPYEKIMSGITMCECGQKMLCFWVK